MPSLPTAAAACLRSDSSIPIDTDGECVYLVRRLLTWLFYGRDVRIRTLLHPGKHAYQSRGSAIFRQSTPFVSRFHDNIFIFVKYRQHSCAAVVCSSFPVYRCGYYCTIYSLCVCELHSPSLPQRHKHGIDRCFHDKSTGRPAETCLVEPGTWRELVGQGRW